MANTMANTMPNSDIEPEYDDAARKMRNATAVAHLAAWVALIAMAMSALAIVMACQ